MGFSKKRYGCWQANIWVLEKEMVVLEFQTTAASYQL